jgi:hypothetical protein
MYPVELCLKFNAESSIWFEYLRVDVMYLHSMLWNTQAYFDRLNGSGNSTEGILHANKTLHLLQKRIAEPGTATSDTTICVVVSPQNLRVLLLLLVALRGKCLKKSQTSERRMFQEA